MSGKNNNEIVDYGQYSEESKQKKGKGTNKTGSETIENKIKQIQKEVNAFIKATTAKALKDIDDEDISKLIDQYSEIILSVDAVKKYTKEAEHINELNAMSEQANFQYSMLLSAINKWQVKQTNMVNDDLKKAQMNIFVFVSLFMTLLTFLLTNSSIVIRSPDQSVKLYLLMNLMVLAVTEVIFIFIGIFLGFSLSNRSKAKIRLCYILLTLVFLITIIALFGVALYVPGNACQESSEGTSELISSAESILSFFKW